MDEVEKTKAEMGRVERFISSLPGIKGYREKEMRRDADKQLRETLARRLESRRRRLSGMQQELLSSGGLLWMDDMERVVGRLQLLIDRVKTAAYGYAPLWGLNRVKEADLERMAEFDRALFGDAVRLDDALAALESAVGASQGVKEALRDLGDLISGLNETFSRRADVIQGVTE